MIRSALIAAVALTLAACASMAPYGQASSPTGQGYSEQRIEQDRYRITYRGVGDQARVADYALLRAADLTIANGYDWFEITQRWTDGRPDSARGLRPSVSIGAGSSRYGGYSSSGVGVGVGLNVSGPSPTATVLEVRLGRGPMPERPNVYDAREVALNTRR